MNYNDISNAATLDGVPKTRKRDWTSAVMIWLFSMIICTNGKKVFESAIGRAIDPKIWRGLVQDSLSMWNSPCKLEKSSEGRCRSCQFFYHHIRRPRHQIWKCFRCQHICRQCHSDGSHKRYLDVVRKGGCLLRRTYENGQIIAKRQRKERESMNSLICAQGLS